MYLLYKKKGKLHLVLIFLNDQEMFASKVAITSLLHLRIQLNLRRQLHITRQLTCTKLVMGYHHHN